MLFIIHLHHTDHLVYHYHRDFHFNVTAGLHPHTLLPLSLHYPIIGFFQTRQYSLKLKAIVDISRER